MDGEMFTYLSIPICSRHGSRYFPIGSTDIHDDKSRSTRADVTFEVGSQSIIDWRESAESHDPLLRSMRETDFNLRTHDSMQTRILSALRTLRTDKNLSALQRESDSCRTIRLGHRVHVHARRKSLRQHWVPSYLSITARLAGSYQSSTRDAVGVGRRK